MQRDIVVLGASAGGVQALEVVLGNMPRRLPASFFVTLHVSPFNESYLPKILERAGTLPARHPQENERIRPGVIYIAPPDFHLLLEAGHIRLGHGPKENRHRPSIDVLFRSAARTYGPRVIGVLLTGNLDDGVAGLLEIRKSGGLTIVQDPSKAAYPEMPMRALAATKVDYCLPLTQISHTIIKLVKESKGSAMVKAKPKRKLANQSPQVIAEPPKDGPRAPLVCPDCQGPLWEFKHGLLTRYECLVGHRFNTESLLAAHSEEVEDALWVALRTLEERVVLQRRLAQDARNQNNSLAAVGFSTKANKNTKHAKLLRKILEELTPES